MELTGKTIGILGMGDIGYAVAKIAMAMDMKVLAYRRRPDLSLENEQLRFVDLDTLLRESDILSLHCPLTGETRGMINREALAKMKDGAILINTGRGAVLEEAAVVEALDSGKLYAVGADVFSGDPCGRDNPACQPSPLHRYPSCRLDSCRNPRPSHRNRGRKSRGVSGKPSSECRECPEACPMSFSRLGLRPEMAEN